MRHVLGLVFGVGVWLLLLFPAAAQQPSSPPPPPQSAPQAVSCLQQALSALGSGQPSTDVTLTGTVQRIAGSDNESGSATLKAMATGEARMDLNLPSGTRSEVSSSSANIPVGQWSGPDGVLHPIAYHNLLTSSAWFYPQFLLTQLNSSNYIVSYVGQETRNGEAVQHVTVYRVFPPPPASVNIRANLASLPQHLSQMEVYLDAKTQLPVAITFDTHPDNNSLLDIPVTIQLSDYRLIADGQAPFHVQKYINNSLVLDLQFSQISLNTGLSSSDFTVTATTSTPVPTGVQQ